MIRANSHEQPDAGDRPPVHLIGARPDVPTRALVGELRAVGTMVRAHYRDRFEVNGDGDDPRIEGGDAATLDPPPNRREWREWIEARDAHVLLAGAPASGLDVIRRAAMARRNRTLHLWVERLRPSQLLMRALRRGYVGSWGLDGIFAVGTRTADTYRAVTGRHVPVHVLPLVTERGLGAPAARAVRPTIGYAGPLLPDRGLDLLLRALARLPASGRPRLQVAGSGPATESLHTRARRLGIDRWVDWLGEIDDEALDAVRARWWGLVVPGQRSDGWDLGIQVALNTGVPVVASRHIHAASDLVRTGTNGTIVRRDDPDRWAEALGELTDPTSRDAWSEGARATGRAFAPRHCAPWLIEVLAAAEHAQTEGHRLASRSFVDHAWEQLVPAHLRSTVQEVPRPAAGPLGSGGGRGAEPSG